MDWQSVGMHGFRFLLAGIWLHSHWSTTSSMASRSRRVTSSCCSKEQTGGDCSWHFFGWQSLVLVQFVISFIFILNSYGVWPWFFILLVRIEECSHQEPQGNKWPSWEGADRREGGILPVGLFGHSCLQPQPRLIFETVGVVFCAILSAVFRWIGIDYCHFICSLCPILVLFLCLLMASFL